MHLVIQRDATKLTAGGRYQARDSNVRPRACMFQLWELEAGFTSSFQLENGN